MCSSFSNSNETRKYDLLECVNLSLVVLVFLDVKKIQQH